MTADHTIHALAQSGADSVFAYIERTAEAVSGGVRWQTKSYDNKTQYDTCVFDGVAGISLFLSDYHRRHGSAKARDLAEGALSWCSAPERESGDLSLYVGRAGLGMGWLRLAEATNDSKFLSRATSAGQVLLEAPPGPATDVIAGAAGQGIFLIRLWEASREERFLAGALRYAEWLEAHAIRDGSGCCWEFEVVAEKSRRALGFSHGVAGIAYFLLLVYEATGDLRWKQLILDASQTLSRDAQPDRGGLNWPADVGSRLGNDRRLYCQWCHGAPGVGQFFVKAAVVLGDSAHLEMARAAGEATFAHGDSRNNPSQCHGLSGNAELFLELYHATQEQRWLERAHAFAVQAFSYRRTGPTGDSWQSDVAGIDSQDFMCGAAGVGHFFLRLGAPTRLRLPLA